MPISYEALLIASLFVVPGYLGELAFCHVIVRQRRESIRLVLEAVAGSMVLWIVVGPLGYWAYRQGWHEDYPFSTTMAVSAIALLLPPLAGYLLGKLVKSECLPLFRLLPPRAWDHRFARAEPLFVRVTLTDNSQIGGLWANNSCASVYPEAEDIYLETLFHLDEHGAFCAIVEDSGGVWIPGRSIKLLEFLKAKEPEDESK